MNARVRRFLVRLIPPRLKAPLKRLLRSSASGVRRLVDPEYRGISALIFRVSREVHLGISFDEAYRLFTDVRDTNAILGDMAEVGVYRGGSAKVLCEAKGPRPLHLFDTFQGIPSVTSIDEPHFKPGDWAAPLDAVKDYLSPYPAVFFHPGLFPDTAGPVRDSRFSFVNLDVDTYQSTKDSLEFFYPRLVKGAILISHDYGWTAGVTKAFNEFFADKPETVEVLAGSQCRIRKQ